MTTGDQIRSARETAGLTQAQLGEHLGVSLRTIGNWERGDTPVSPRQMARLRAVLGPIGEADSSDPLADVSDVELLAEIARRFARTNQEESDRHDAAPMNEVSARIEKGLRPGEPLPGSTSQSPATGRPAPGRT